MGPPLVVVDVAPADVDGYGIVHFARYPLYAEQAGLAFLEGRGFGLDGLDNLGLGLRVRELRVTYRASARLGDRLFLHAEKARLGRAYLRVAVQIQRAVPDGERELLTHVEMDYVFVDTVQASATLVPPGLAATLGGAG